jgi:hypothetical protein
MSATLESTIVRLHRSGFGPTKIAKLVHVSPSKVRQHLPANAVDVPAMDLTFLPTAEMKAAAGQALAERSRSPAPTGRHIPWAKGELKLLRLCVAQGYTLAQIGEAISRLGIHRSPGSVGTAAAANGIKVNSRGRRRTDAEGEL